MKELMSFLVANFNSIGVNSTNLHTGFEYFHIDCNNHMSQRVEIDISIDDNYWRLRIFALSTIQYEKTFENSKDLVERLNDFVNSRDFSRAH